MKKARRRLGLGIRYQQDFHGFSTNAVESSRSLLKEGASDEVYLPANRGIFAVLGRLQCAPKEGRLVIVGEVSQGQSASQLLKRLRAASRNT